LRRRKRCSNVRFGLWTTERRLERWRPAEHRGFPINTFTRQNRWVDRAAYRDPLEQSRPLVTDNLPPIWLPELAQCDAGFPFLQDRYDL